MRWIGKQLKKIADPLNNRYVLISSLQGIGRRLRFVGDILNNRNETIVFDILNAVELYLVRL